VVTSYAEGREKVADHPLWGGEAVPYTEARERDEIGMSLEEPRPGAKGNEKQKWSSIRLTLGIKTLKKGGAICFGR